MSGQDLIINETLMPTSIFTRGLMLDVFYEFTIPQMDNLGEILSNIDFIGTIDNIVVSDIELIGDVRYIYANGNPILSR